MFLCVQAFIDELTSIISYAINPYEGFGLGGKYPFLHFDSDDEGYLVWRWWLYILSTARSCPLLASVPQHGSMNCSHSYSPFSYGSRCDFECNEGFWMRGTSATTCNNSGHWSPDVPTCQRESLLPSITINSSVIRSADFITFTVLPSCTVWGHPSPVFTSVYGMLPSPGEFQLWLSVSFHL